MKIKKITPATHTPFLNDYDKDVNTPLNGGNMFNQLTGNLGAAISAGILQHFNIADATIPWVSKSETNNRTGLPTRYYLEDTSIAVDITDPDTGDIMQVSPIGAASNGLLRLMDMIEIDTLEIANRLDLKLSKKQCRAILDFIEGVDYLVDMGWIIHTPKASKVKAKKAVELRSVKASKSKWKNPNSTPKRTVKMDTPAASLTADENKLLEQLLAKMTS
jgi:hypothetical protein